jgi:stage V sporulation protein B
MISKSKAEGNAQGEKNALSAGLFGCLLLSLPFALAFWLFGEKMSFLFSDTRSFPVFRVLLIGLCLSCVYAVFRGYYWGNKNFLTPSLLEISEEAVMVIAGLCLLQTVPSPAVGAERAAWAVVISYLFSFTASTICFFVHGGKLTSPKKELKPLFNASLPITSVRASGSLVTSAVAVLLPAMLIRAGMDEREAVKLFGIVTGMVFPILFIPSTLLGSLSLVLVPELAEDYYRKNYERLKKNILRGLRFALFLSCALIPFFYALGQELGLLAFSNQTAGEMIKRSGIILLPMSLTMISSSILNSIGFEKQTFVFFFVGAAALLLSVLILPPYCGGYAYLIGLGLSYVLTAACNLIFLYKKCPFLKKERGQVCDHTPFITIFALLPFSLLGQLCNTLFSKFSGSFLCMLLTAFTLAMATTILYLSLQIIPLPKRKKKAMLFPKKYFSRP